jgi:ABC-type transport system involved in cytochrome c biogenesis permease subunit
MNRASRWIPWIVGVAAALFVLLLLVLQLNQKPEAGFHVREFGRLPVLLEGRVQPFDSVGRNALRQLRNKQTGLRDGRSLPATVWLLETMLRPSEADQLKTFRIDHHELLGLLDLPDTEKHFSFEQLRPSLAALEREARRASEKENQLRTPFERQTLQLYSALVLYQRLKNSLKPETSSDFAAELAEYQSIIPDGVAAVHAHQAGGGFDQEAFGKILEHLQRYNHMANSAYPLIIPPLDRNANPDAWENMGTTLMSTVHTGKLHPAARWYATMASAYRNDDPATFNRALDEYHEWLAAHTAPELKKGRSEHFFNAFRPFYKATALYILAFLLVSFSWVKASEPARRSAYALVVVAFIVHTLGLIFRMTLEGRPPVTNLYSSAVFIGWGAALLGLILERFSTVGIGIASAALVGFVTQIIAHNLALGGDTMVMMQAVLDTNFWLATHVVVITIGYSANFVAGVLGILLIVLGVMTRTLNPSTASSVSRMIYGIICFATLFSFAGTVLGGIWADQSWGRFWGWDPKENGALMIVLWNAIILHCRWGGLIRERGMAIMAIFGNVITSFSWFGTNMLGIGLHAYGFMDSGFKWLTLFVLSQLLVMGVGLLPKHRWRSYRSAAS